ncbi:MAG: hypothetical protein JNK35_12125, partial [Phycisphaerae bacterium]|nr:hypothetical protein [Phycisphaerae bacterium]
AGKLLHEAPGGGVIDFSIVDYNRAGTPLLEIVTEPDFRSADEVVLFCQVLRDLCRFIGASRGVLQRGHMRFEPNVNCVLTLDDGREVRTPIVEVKNLNSFRAVRGAIEFEAREQPRRWAETGREHGPGTKETRGWDDRAGVTLPQRGKEDAQDYRYFPDPDLLPVSISKAMVERLRNGLPELPLARRARYRGAWGLNDRDAAALTAEREESDYFEAAVAAAAAVGVPMERVPKAVAVVLLQSGAKRREAAAAESGEGTDGGDDEGGSTGRGGETARDTGSARLISSLGVSAQQVAEIVALRDRGEVSAAGVDTIFGALTDPARANASARAVAGELGLLLTQDEGAMDRWADEAIALNPGPAADVRAGKEAAVGRIVGAAVKLAGGRADAAALRAKIIARLRPAGSDPQ